MKCTDKKKKGEQMEKITLLLVDDHPLIREGLRRIIDAAEDLEVLRESGDGKEALLLARQLPIQVLVMDINLPHLNGLQVLRELKTTHPHIAVILLTAHHSKEQSYYAIRSGASAYFPKEVEAERITSAIRQVSQGNFVMEGKVMNKPELEDWLAEHFAEVADIDGFPNEMFSLLSPREMEILQYIARGNSNKEVAYKLGISSQTVKNHMTSILRKLALNDRTQAAMYAARRGWIRLNDETNS
jgi:DNA-binding NarL/FixJ family response regulator